MLLDGSMLENIQASLFRIFVGCGIGLLIGAPSGLMMGSIRIIREFIEPYVEFFRYIPALSLVTVSLIWFGIGEASKIFLIIYATVFIIVVNTMAGVHTISPDKLRAARCLGAKRYQMFVFVSLPATVPFIITGARIAMGNAFTTIVAAEMVAAQSGLGFVIFNSRLFMKTDAIFVAIIALGFLGFLTDRVFRFVIGKFFSRFAPQI
jgi:NitT/TauT family transport system permease protein